MVCEKNILIFDIVNYQLIKTVTFLSGRWDFDTQEEYSDYMSTKEALPKAAFQYGVKMQDGRKTRKNKTEKNEKAELDREWQKIQVRAM